MARKKSPTDDEIRRAIEEAEAAAPASDSAFDRLGDASAGPSDLTREDVETWILSRGWTPIEFLTHTYRNGHQRMEHRIAAAKAVLEYVHRKLPQKVELDADVTTRGLTLDASTLSKLSDKELESLEKILSKVGP
jgi:hypothetical protein